MIAHVVLLTPRPDLSASDRAAAFEALTRSTAAIPEIVRARIGRRVTHGLPGYEQQMKQHFEVALLLEFADTASLQRYLRNPAHGELGHLFSSATSAAIAYDFEIEAPAHAKRLWADDPGVAPAPS